MTCRDKKFHDMGCLCHDIHNCLKSTIYIDYDANDYDHVVNVIVYFCNIDVSYTNYVHKKFVMTLFSTCCGE